jgi:SAM-dependent methyltransferase
MNTVSHFDAFADRYDASLNEALSITGDDKEYFAKARLQWLYKKLGSLGENPGSVLDYGCGTGDTCHLLCGMPDVRCVEGVDVSQRSIEIARRQNQSRECSFYATTEYRPSGSIDMAYCNGVFHHIPVLDRSAAVEYIYRCLRPGGLFAFWENNPWNPATRFIMSRCAFDGDAITLSSRESCALLRAGGLEILSVDYLFFFPRFLSMFRPAEPVLSRVPLGGQYQVLCRKPQNKE